MKQDIHLAVVQYLDFNPILVRFKLVPDITGGVVSGGF